MEMIEKVVMRGLDIIISSFLLLILSPIFVGICYRIYKKEGNPIFYQRAYARKDGKTFIMYSFRTMTVPSQVIFALPVYSSRGPNKVNLPDESMINREPDCVVTLTGKKLRKTGLYRLPRLWNVLKGDISLIGPKPYLIEVGSQEYVWRNNKV